MTAITPPRRQRLLLWLVLLPSLVIAAVLFGFYFVVRPAFPIVERYYFPEQAATYLTYRVPLYLHIGFGTLALVAGSLNLVLTLRRGVRRAHRVLGALFAVGVAVSAPASVVMAFHAYAGRMPGGRIVATTGFVLLGLCWLAALVAALHAVLVRRNAAAHRFWMVAAFAMTFAAVTLRAQVGLLNIGGVGTFEYWYPALAWSCWLPNLAVALPLAVRLNRRRAAAQPRAVESTAATATGAPRKRNDT